MTSGTASEYARQAADLPHSDLRYARSSPNTRHRPRPIPIRIGSTALFRREIVPDVAHLRSMRRAAARLGAAGRVCRRVREVVQEGLDAYHSCAPCGPMPSARRRLIPSCSKEGRDRLLIGACRVHASKIHLLSPQRAAAPRVQTLPALGG